MVSWGWLHPTVIYYFHGREVGFTRRFGILGFATVTRGWFHPTVICYLHGREVGLPTV